MQVQREVERTGIRPCIWQIEVVRKVLEGVDVMTIAATGSGMQIWQVTVLLDGSPTSPVCKAWNCLPRDAIEVAWKAIF